MFMRSAAIMLILATGLPVAATAQLPKQEGGVSPLGVRQQHVEQLMAELEQKFKSLKLALQESEPDQAEKLQQALNRAKELLIQRRMADITKLLDQTQLDPATDSQQAVLVDIHTVLDLLLQESDGRDQAPGKKLDELEKRFRDMLADQQRLTSQTSALETKRREKGGELARGDRNALRGIGEDERRTQAVRGGVDPRPPGLAGRAQQALEGMGDESATLADGVAQLRDDLTRVGNLLTDNLQSGAEVTAQQTEIEASLERLIEAVKQLKHERQEQSNNDGQGGKRGPPGLPQQQSQRGESPDPSRRDGQQGGTTGGGSKATDGAAATRLPGNGPQSPWSKLREKDRDPVYSAIKEKYPARYRQLIEQYYKSFQGDE